MLLQRGTRTCTCTKISSKVHRYVYSCTPIDTVRVLPEVLLPYESIDTSVLPDGSTHFGSTFVLSYFRTSGRTCSHVPVPSKV